METSSSMNMDSLKTYALPIIAAVVVVAAVPLAIMPWFNDITTNWDKAAVESDRRDALKVKADALEKFDVTENKALLEQTVLPAIPATMDPAGLLGTIEQVARVAGVGVKGITYANGAVSAVQPSDAAAKVEGLGSITATVSMEGSYEQIAMFITRSEMVSRVLALETLHITKGEGDTPATASFDIRSPYIPHPATLALEAPFQELGSAETSVVDYLKSFEEVDYAPTDVSSIVGKTSPF